MNYLLDTATWANSVIMPEVLPEKVRRLVGTREKKGLASVSLLECAIHYRHERLQLQSTLRDFFVLGLADDIELLELTPDIAAATNELPKNFPGDPFDRVIAATARLRNLRLVTPDPVIRDAAFCQVEYYPFRPSRRIR